MLIMGNLLEKFSTLFTRKTNPATSIPTAIVMGATLRPGMTTASTVSRIFKELEAQGFNLAPMESGEENDMAKLVMAITRGILDEIHENAVVTTTTPPGGLTIMGVGGNAGGPVTVEGISTNFPDQKGVIQ